MDDLLIKDFEVLIKSISNMFFGIDKEDLIQAGNVGLINAYKHYDKNSNTKFSTYAYNYIYGEMYNLMINNKNIKINRDTLKLVKLVDKTKEYLEQKQKREVSLSEIAFYLKIDLSLLENAVISTKNILSLDKETEDNDNFYNICKYEENNDMKLDIYDGINNLEKQEREIIKCRYFNDLTQSETAKKLGITQVKVSRYEQKSLKKLKKIMMYE